jgi:cell wall-associated NlpC family hydrolase
MSWIHTPYHLTGMVKGGGVDCATLLYCVYKNCGLVPDDDEKIEHYTQDWFCHTKTEKYGLRVLRHAHKVAEGVGYPCMEALPGNLVLTRAVHSKVWNHGGIVIKWPRIVHAVDPEVALKYSHALPVVLPASDGARPVGKNEIGCGKIEFGD